MDEKSFNLDMLKAAMQSPEVKNAKPENLISTLSGMFGLELDPVDEAETRRIRETYFQAIVLEKDNWTKLPGISNYVQISPFKLKEVPPGLAIVADVLVDQSDYEVECFDKYIKNMAIRGKSIVFYASTDIPITLTIGLKCVDQKTREVKAVDPEFFRKGVK